MSVMGLTNRIAVPTMVPQRLYPQVPVHLIKSIGRQGLNMYRTINGNRTIADIARLFGKPETEVLRVMRLFYKAGYVVMETPKKEMKKEIEMIPTVIISHKKLGLANY